MPARATSAKYRSNSSPPPALPGRLGAARGAAAPPPPPAGAAEVGAPALGLPRPPLPPLLPVACAATGWVKVKRPTGELSKVRTAVAPAAAMHRRPSSTPCNQPGKQDGSQRYRHRVGQHVCRPAITPLVAAAPEARRRPLRPDPGLPPARPLLLLSCPALP